VRPTSSQSELKTLKVRSYVFNDDVEALTAYMSQEKFDGIIHLASLYLKQHQSTEVLNLVDSNVAFGSALLEAAAQSATPWFMNTGTFWQHYRDATYSPVNLYAATKQAFQDITQYYVETSSVNIVTLQLSDTFGPDDTRPKIFNLWAKIAKTQETLKMSGGEQLIDISYIDNVIDGYLQLATLLTADTQHALQGKVFALTSGNPVPLKVLANVFEKVTNVTLPIVWGKKPYMPREVMQPWSKGEKIPGWEPKVPLEEGIKRTFHE
jgi:nucleoside-diphosphate-sugar epimerase